MICYGMFILNNVLNGKYHTDEQEIIKEIKHIPYGMVWYAMFILNNIRNGRYPMEI